MAVGLCSSKIVLIVIGLVFWGIAAALGYLGGSIWNYYDNFSDIFKSYYAAAPGGTLIGAAALSLIVGVLICGSVCSKSRCLIACVFSILLVIFLAQLAAAILGYAYRGKVTDLLESNMDTALEKYLNNSAIAKQVDFTQSEFECCGVHNYTDWFKKPWHTEHPDRVPSSCCKELCEHGVSPIIRSNASSVYVKGCYDRLHDDLISDLGIVVGVALGFALLQILGMIASCVLLCRSRENNPYREMGGERTVSGLRV